jgi:tetratricopeptide (TPR) repeat protein
MIGRSSGCREEPPRREDGARSETPADPGASYRAEADRLAREAEDLYARKRYRQAEGLVLRLLDLQEEALGKRHPEYATGLSMLGELRFLQGDRDGAEPLLREAVAIRREALGTRHPEYAVGLCCLAGLLARTGGQDEAEALLREAVAIRREVLGGRHPDTLHARAELARLLRRRGGPARAGSRPRPGADVPAEVAEVDPPSPPGDVPATGPAIVLAPCLPAGPAAGARLFGSCVVGGPLALPPDAVRRDIPRARDEGPAARAPRAIRVELRPATR